MSHDDASWALGTTRTSAALAYDRLRQAIITGELAPGERLTETRMAERLGVSRTPVREAFARLVKDGLLRAAERAGVMVADTEAEFVEIHHLREAIEGCAARLAALRSTPQEKAEIMALAVSSQSADPDQLRLRARLNRAFHLAIAAASHAPRVERLVQDYQALFASPIILRAYTSGDTNAALVAHMDIASAICDGDGDAAERAMRQHVRVPSVSRDRRDATEGETPRRSPGSRAVRARAG